MYKSDCIFFFFFQNNFHISNFTKTKTIIFIFRYAVEKKSFQNKQVTNNTLIKEWRPNKLNKWHQNVWFAKTKLEKYAPSARRSSIAQANVNYRI